jgi:hypothetical protein
MRDRAVCLLAWFFVACSSGKGAQPARPPPSGDDGDHGAAALPPEVGKMIEPQPCQSRLHAPLHQHRLARSDGSKAFMIGAGEKLCLVGSSPAALALTDAIVPLDPASANSVSAELNVNNAGSFLMIRNNFDRPLRYRAVLKAPNRPAQPTTVCPVRPHLLALEHWPYPLEAIAFGDFTPLATGDAPECK